MHQVTSNPSSVFQIRVPCTSRVCALTSAMDFNYNFRFAEIKHIYFLYYNTIKIMAINQPLDDSEVCVAAFS